MAGIPIDKLESVFDRFHQVDASDSRQKGGTGLGLAICRTIVQQHGGRIWAERNADQGSTFRVLLPDRSRLEGPADRPTLLPPAREETVLVCEPDAEARRAIVEGLRRQDYRILEAENREQAVQLANHFPPGAILLGVSNHPRNGVETLQALKECVDNTPAFRPLPPRRSLSAPQSTPTRAPKGSEPRTGLPNSLESSN